MTAKRPVVLVIAGSDSSGMAGVQMDTRTAAAMGAHTATAVTATTAQNNAGVLSVNPVSDNALMDQLNANATLPVAVIKTGLLCSVEQIKKIDKLVSETALPLVLDPVMASTSGKVFADESIVNALKTLLLPAATLITPNVMEAERLTGEKIRCTDDVEKAARKLARSGTAVLITGGHLGSPWSQDYFYSEEKAFWLSSARSGTANVRGTGCALASAIASSMALGYSLCDAIVIGKMAINQGLRLGYSTETGIGPVCVHRFPDEQQDLPWLTDSPHFDFGRVSFPGCNGTPMGLYPIVDRADWLYRLLPCGITTSQLRVKDLQGQALENEIARGIEIARQYQCRLFINDYWELAIKGGAYGVHLGQEDLDSADTDAILVAGLRLGISTHCHYEVAKAHSYKPSYIACGPVYHTNTKAMPWTPLDLKGLSYWRKVLQYPLVAIGGINQERIQPVAQAGADGIAMITAITRADKPEAAVGQMMKRIWQAQTDKMQGQ